jgi:hypothetical protein
MFSPYKRVSGIQNRRVQDMDNNAGQGPPTDSTSGSRQRGLHPDVRAQDLFAGLNPSPPTSVSANRAVTPRQARFELIDRTRPHRVCGACLCIVGPSWAPLTGPQPM